MGLTRQGFRLGFSGTAYAAALSPAWLLSLATMILARSAVPCRAKAPLYPHRSYFAPAKTCARRALVERQVLPRVKWAYYDGHLSP